MLRLKTPIWFILTQRTHPIYPKPRAFDILWVLRSKFKAEEAPDASDPRRPLTKVRSALHQSRQTSYSGVPVVFPASQFSWNELSEPSSVIVA